MAGKRKTKTPKHDAALGPSKWRLQHGGFGEAVRSADPETGTPVAHRYAMDTLGVMLSNGTITTEMRDAGEMFRKQFRFAALDTLRPMPLIRIPGGRGGDTATEQQFQARERVGCCHRCPGRPWQPCWSLCVACRGPGELDHRMGPPLGLVRSSHRSCAGSGRAGLGAGRAGDALRADAAGGIAAQHERESRGRRWARSVRCRAKGLIYATEILNINHSQGKGAFQHLVHEPLVAGAYRRRKEEQ